MEASLDLQKALRTRLIADTALTSLVPAAAIFDRNARPETFPCILIGEAQTLPDEGLMRLRTMVYADLHIWSTEPGLVVSKQIVGAIRNALADTLWALDHHHVADICIETTRFMRDPDGIHAHGLMTIKARLVELAS